jgi:hypothetical protein
MAIDPPNYSSWARKLADHFFNREHRFQPVLLSIETEELEAFGGDVDELIRAIVTEAQSRGCRDIQRLAVQLEREWARQLKNGADEVLMPPFIPILVIYVLAVNHGGDEKPAHSYYARLHELLGSPAERIQSLDPSQRIWKALERWSTRDMAGQLGVFDAGIVGQQEYVGIPRRQALIAPREVTALRRAFVRVGLEPGSVPTDRRLLAAVTQAEGLLARTNRLLRDWPGTEPSRELLAECRRHFERWDRIDPADLPPDETIRLPVRLALQTSRTGISSGQFEVEVVDAITDFEYELDPKSTKAHALPRLWVRPGDGGTRSVIVDEHGDPEWVTPDRWFESIELKVPDNAVTLFRPPRPALMFSRSAIAGRVDEVYSADLRSGDVYLLVVPEGRIPDSTPEYVDAFEAAEWTVRGGIAHRPFRAATSSADDTTTQPALRLVRGIPSDPERGRDAYVHFALPEIQVTGAFDTNGPPEVVLRTIDERGQEFGPLRLLTLTPEAQDSDSLLTTPSVYASYTGTLPELPADCAICEIDLKVATEVVSLSRFFVDRVPISDAAVDPVGRDALGLIADADDDVVIRGLTQAEMTPDVAYRPVAHGVTSLESAPEDDMAGLRTMQLLRIRGQLSWQNARRWLPGCMPTGTADNAHLMHAIFALHSLGIIELEERSEGGLDRILANPPMLVLLPRRANLGIRQHGGRFISDEAVLAGCWLPEELADLERVSKTYGVERWTSARPMGAALAPHRRALTSDSGLDPLKEVARELDVPFDPLAPLACRLASVLASIDTLRNRGGWITGRPSDVWSCRYFDPRNIGVSRTPLTTDDRFVLWECKHPNYPVWQHFVIDQELNRHLAVADRQLARWFVRVQALPNTPIPVSGDTLFVPLELRLPRILERVLVLSSGYAPILKRFTGVRSPFAKRTESERFQIPAPPDHVVDWLAFRQSCTGNFCCYRGSYRTAAWPLGEPIPMLGLSPRQTQGLGLGG